MISEEMDLSNQVAVITGAGSGIGRAIALALAKQNVKLALVGRTLEKLQRVADEARPAAPEIRCYAADLACDKQIQKLAGELQADFGQVDVLVHGAAVFSSGTVETGSVEDLDRLYRVNFRGPYLLTQALLSSLRAQRGQIVFLNSTVGLEARGRVAQYAASKHSLRALADSLRDEVNGDGIRVLSLYLGRTATPMQVQVFSNENRDYHPELLLQPEDVATVLVTALTLPHTAEVTEIRMRPLAASY